jgi:hypothetical protein
VAASALLSLQTPSAKSCLAAPQNTPPLLGPPTAPDSRAVLACTPLHSATHQKHATLHSAFRLRDRRETGGNPWLASTAVTLAAAFDGALSPLTDKLLAALRVPADLASPPKSVCPLRKTRPRHSLPPREPVPGIAHKAESATPASPLDVGTPPLRESASGKGKCESHRRHFPRQPHPHFAPKVSLALGGRRFALGLTARPVSHRATARRYTLPAKRQNSAAPATHWNALPQVRPRSVNGWHEAPQDGRCGFMAEASPVQPLETAQRPEHRSIHKGGKPEDDARELRGPLNGFACSPMQSRTWRCG